MTNGFAHCNAYLQGSAGICHEQSNTEFSDGACKESRVERERKRASYAGFLSWSKVFLFVQYNEQKQEQI